MTTQLTTRPPNTLTTRQALGQAADQAAARNAFVEYRQLQAANTLRRQTGDLNLFADFLTEAGTAAEGAALASEPDAWQGVTWGLVSAFRRWMLHKGYAVGSVNVRLATVRRYAELATKAGVLSPESLAMIRTVKGYSDTEGKRLDAQRSDAATPVRIGTKKADSIVLSKAQKAALKQQPDTAQGRRDRLIICLMVEQGLRCGEVAALRVTDFDLENRLLIFHREKVDKTQTHNLNRDTYRAARDYFKQDAPIAGPLLRGSDKTGRLTDSGMAVQNITARVRTLGEAIGVEGLSAHDLRHTWATLAARAGTPIDRLQEAGGWSNPVTPLKNYIEPAKIANEGVITE